MVLLWVLKRWKLCVFHGGVSAEVELGLDEGYCDIMHVEVEHSCLSVWLSVHERSPRRPPRLRVTISLPDVPGDVRVHWEVNTQPCDHITTTVFSRAECGGAVLSGMSLQPYALKPVLTPSPLVFDLS